MSIEASGSQEEAVKIFRRQWNYLCGEPAAKSLWRKLTPDQRRRLGGDLHAAIVRHRRTIEMWMLLQGVSAERAAVELAVKLFSFPSEEADWLLRELGELPMDSDAAQSEAIARGDLVLIRSERLVYWKGADLEIDWGCGKTPWEFFVTACEHALQGKDIDRLSFGDAAYDNIVSDRLYRLGNVPNFPQELLNYFETSGLQTQRFTYPAEAIHIFDD